MDEFEVRQEALAHAVKIAAEQQIEMFNAQVTVGMAKAFEKYLLGEESK